MLDRSILELEADKREKLIIDIRRKEEYEKDTYPDAINIFWDDIDDHIEELPKDKPIYLICYYGRESSILAESLRDEGFDTYNVSGGFREYLRIKLERYFSTEGSVRDKHKQIEQSIIKKFRKDIWKKFTKAINEYKLIEDGDKIAVCISGGKDSMLMAKLFQELKRHNKFPFTLHFLCMDPGYNAYNRQIIEENAALLGIPLEFFQSDIFESVFTIDSSPCYVCARMRRGHLYSKAKELGCNKIALGHHFDDVIETVLMGMLYSGQFQAMMPKLHSTNFEGMELIRPLYYVREEDIIHWRNYNQLNFIQCACKFTETCSSCHVDGTTSSKRLEIKKLIASLKEVNPFIEKNIFRSTENVSINTILGLKTDGEKHSFLEWYDKGFEFPNTKIEI